MHSPYAGSQIMMPQAMPITPVAGIQAPGFIGSQIIGAQPMMGSQIYGGEYLGNAGLYGLGA